jgi:hypothetical protein
MRKNKNKEYVASRQVEKTKRNENREQKRQESEPISRMIKIPSI